MIDLGGVLVLEGAFEQLQPLIDLSLVDVEASGGSRALAHVPLLDRDPRVHHTLRCSPDLASQLLQVMCYLWGLLDADEVVFDCVAHLGRRALRQNLAIDRSLPQLVGIDVPGLVVVALRVVAKLGGRILGALNLEMRVTDSRNVCMVLPLRVGVCLVVGCHHILSVLAEARFLIVVRNLRCVSGRGLDAATVVDQGRS